MPVGMEMIRVTKDRELDDATRAALASGRAELGLRIFIDTLMEMRGIPEGEGEVVAAAALEAEAPAGMSPSALDMAFAAIERGGRARPARPLAYPELAGLPADLLDLVRAAEAKNGWAWSGPGIRRLDLVNERGLKLEIIRLGAGREVPWHTHKGRELTLCIQGEFTDGLATYGPGDFSITDGTIRHQPRAHPGAPAYALAVTDAGLRFEGLLGALQRIFGQ